MTKKEKTIVSKTTISVLEVFSNPHPKRSYEIEIESTEFTSVCPITGQPDFGTVCITYIPCKKCVELKSLKFYLQQYRNKGIFYEDLTNKILNDLVKVCSPRYMKIETRWKPRGGITTNITSVYRKKGNIK